MKQGKSERVSKRLLQRMKQGESGRVSKQLLRRMKQSEFGRVSKQQLQRTNEDKFQRGCSSDREWEQITKQQTKKHRCVEVKILLHLAKDG